MECMFYGMEQRKCRGVLIHPSLVMLSGMPHENNQKRVMMKFSCGFIGRNAVSARKVLSAGYARSNRHIKGMKKSSLLRYNNRREDFVCALAPEISCDRRFAQSYCADVSAGNVKSVFSTPSPYMVLKSSRIEMTW